MSARSLFRHLRASSSARRGHIRAAVGPGGALALALCGCGDADVLIGSHTTRSATGDASTVSDASSVSDASTVSDVPMRPPGCMMNRDCVEQCPRISRGCVCAPTMMGLRCVPTCTVTPECPPAPTGMMLFCRMGLCVP